MIRTFKTLLLVIVAGISFTACEKEYSEENGLLPGSGGGGGNGGGGGGGNNATCKSCTYQPWCDGSVYTYVDTTGAGATTTSQTLDILADTTIDGKTFHKTDAGSSSNLSYQNCTNGVTTLVAYNPVGTGGSTVERINTVPIKENEPVGATWQEVNAVTGGNAVYDYEIISKGSSRTVLGVTFPDVIHVHQTLSTEVFGISIPQAETDYYYAKNVGLIEAYTVDAFFGSLLLHRVLQSYSIP
ncbi:MAG: hypothetical protein V9E88_02140 [Ferruginibacter sp.]